MLIFAIGGFILILNTWVWLLVTKHVYLFLLMGQNIVFWVWLVFVAACLVGFQGKWEFVMCILDLFASTSKRSAKKKETVWYISGLKTWRFPLTAFLPTSSLGPVSQA